MKALTPILAVIMIGCISAAAELPPKPVDYLKLSYAGMKRGQVYLRIHNNSDKVVSYVSDSGNKIPIHYTDVYRPSHWRRDNGLRCATGRSLAELAPGESCRFRVQAGALRPVVGDKIRIRLRCRPTLKSAWQTAASKPETFVSKPITVTKKEVEQDVTPNR